MRRHAEHHHHDGIVSTASLGVAAAGATHQTILLTSRSALIAGAMSIASGEFVPVHAQEDTEVADLARERAELAGIQVAGQLMAHDALAMAVTAGAGAAFGAEA